MAVLLVILSSHQLNVTFKYYVWFLDLCIIVCIQTQKEHVIKTGSVSIIKWQVEEASAELGLTEGAVGYWFIDWDSSVCQTQTHTPPHPFTQGYERFQCLKFYVVFWIWDGRQVQGPTAGTPRCMQYLHQKTIPIKTDVPVNVSVPLFLLMLLQTKMNVAGSNITKSRLLWNVMWLYMETHHFLLL